MISKTGGGSGMAMVVQTATTAEKTATSASLDLVDGTLLEAVSSWKEDSAYVPMPVAGRPPGGCL